MLDQLAAQRAIVRDHIQKERDNDWPAVVATFTAGAHAHFDAVAFETQFKPGDLYGILSAALHDVTVTETSSFDVPGVSVREVTVSGAHQGAYLGVAATGRKVSFESGCLFLFEQHGDETRLLCERVYFDNNTLLQQMTSAPDTPAGVGLVAAAGGAVAGEAAVSPAQREAVLAKQRAAVEEHLSLENAHAWDALVATFPNSAEGFFDCVPMWSHAPTQAGVAESYAMLSAALPDMAVEVTSALDVPGWSVREVIISGTQDGPYLDRPATGLPVRLRALCLFPFAVEGESVTLLGERVYYDNLTIFQQITPPEGAAKAV